MVKQNALETTQISLTIPTKWVEQISKLSTTYSLTKQDIIKQWIAEKLSMIPTTMEVHN